MLNDLADFPAISFMEVWGESPIYRNRCWAVSWSLTATQIETVNQYLSAEQRWTDMKPMDFGPYAQDKIPAFLLEFNRYL